MGRYHYYNILLTAVIVFLLLAIAFNALEDTLVHHYDSSVFAGLGHDSYWFPDWTRAYVNGDPAQGHRWMAYIPGGRMFVDGWHLAKNLRWWMIGNMLFMMLLIFECERVISLWYQLNSWKIIKYYFFFMMAYFGIVYLIHVAFYDWILR
jgi:hypothetical protein